MHAALQGGTAVWSWESCLLGQEMEFGEFVVVLMYCLTWTNLLENEIAMA